MGWSCHVPRQADSQPIRDQRLVAPSAALRAGSVNQIAQDNFLQLPVSSFEDSLRLAGHVGPDSHASLGALALQMSKKAQEYVKHAADCRRLARYSAKDDERKQLLIMAATWDALAASRASDPSEPSPPKLGGLSLKTHL
jgi:hypothetical protein